MITIKNKGALDIYSNAIKSIDNFSQPLKETRKMQLKEIDEAFKVSGKNIIGKQWTRLKPATIKEKLKAGYQTNILVRTGRMRRSFKTIKFSKNNLQITSVGVPYFRKHQLGVSGSTFSPRIPRRQMLGHSKKMIDKTLDIFTKYIIKTIKNG